MRDTSVTKAGLARRSARASPIPIPSKDKDPLRRASRTRAGTNTTTRTKEEGTVMSETAPDGGPWLPLSQKGMDTTTAADFTCDYPGCDKRATTYLFMGPQACCKEHLYAGKSFR